MVKVHLTDIGSFCGEGKYSYYEHFGYHLIS